MTKTILITGSTDGIGLEAAKTLASQGHTLILHGRNPQKLAEAKGEVEKVSSSSVATYEADFSNLAEVRNMAESIMQDSVQLDVVINNAGVLKSPAPITSDGFDIRFVVNLFAPYVLTEALLGSLSAGGRVVNLSSAAQAPVDLEAMSGSIELEEFDAYSQSKLALTMWTMELAAANPAITAIALNPGSLLATKMVQEGFGMEGKDSSIGSNVIAAAATSPEFGQAVSGKYYDNDAGAFAQPHPAASSPKTRVELVAAIDAIVKSN